MSKPKSKPKLKHRVLRGYMTRQEITQPESAIITPLTIAASRSDRDDRRVKVTIEWREK